MQNSAVRGISGQPRRARLGAIEGLRTSVAFKLGYPNTSKKEADALFDLIKQSVALAFEMASEKTDNLNINRNVPFDWALRVAGDHALEFVLYYHPEPLPEIKLTKKIRNHLRGTNNEVVRLLYEAAVSRGLSLATPALLKLEEQGESEVVYAAAQRS